MPDQTRPIASAARRRVRGRVVPRTGRWAAPLALALVVTLPGVELAGVNMQLLEYVGR